MRQYASDRLTWPTVWLAERTRYGRRLEEFEVGAIDEHRPGRTITDVDSKLAGFLNTIAQQGVGQQS